MKRKVLIIVENASVPFDTRVWKEACALRNSGYDVTVLCPRARGYVRGREIIDGILIYRHPMPNEGKTPAGYLVEYGIALFWEWLYAWWIYLRHGFQVMQGCNPPDDIVLVACQFKLCGVKYIFDHHDANPELFLFKYGRKNWLYKVQRWLERITFLFSDVVMSTNDSYRELAIRRGGVNPRDVFVVRNGPDLSQFKPVAPDPGLKRGKDYLVGYVGTMNAQDGLDILLDVATQVKTLGRRDVQFTCVGGGPALEGLRRMAHDRGLDDTVTFTGRISDEELLKILSTADVCVNPDVPCEMNDISTMIKIMEYMALGKPIVQFDLREGRVSAGEAALYVDNSLGAAGFAAKLLWLLGHPDERQRRGELGRRRVEEKLAWKYSVSNLLAAYERTFSKSRGRGQAPAERPECGEPAEVPAAGPAQRAMPGAPTGGSVHRRA